MSRQDVTLKRARFTLNQVRYLAGCDISVDCRDFGMTRANQRRSVILTANQADQILAVVPRTGRTAMSIRRQVAELLRAAEKRTEAGVPTLPACPDLRSIADSYFAAVDAELDAESQRAALEGEFSETERLW